MKNSESLLNIFDAKNRKEETASKMAKNETGSSHGLYQVNRKKTIADLSRDWSLTVETTSLV